LRFLTPFQLENCDNSEIAKKREKSEKNIKKTSKKREKTRFFVFSKNLTQIYRNSPSKFLPKPCFRGFSGFDPISEGKLR